MSLKFPTEEGSKFKLYNVDGKVHMTLITFKGLPLCLCNSIRRILLSEIPIACVKVLDSEPIIEKNETPIHNEYISQRIGLIPLHYNNLRGKGVYHIKSNWNQSDGRTYILTNDNEGKIVLGSSDKSVDKSVNYSYLKLDGKEPGNNKYLEYLKLGDNNPLNNVNTQSYAMKLNKSGVELKLIDKTKLEVETGVYNSRFSPVSFISWDFLLEDTLVGDGDPICEPVRGERERSFRLSKKYMGDPESISMRLKSDHMEPDKLYKLALIVLSKKIDDIVDFKSSIDSEYIDFEQYKYDSIVIKMRVENDTMGNIISSLGKYYLIETKGQLSYISYKITHPLEHDIIIKLSIDESKRDLFSQAKDLHIETNDDDDEERLRIYKLVSLKYIKQMLEWIKSEYFETIDDKDYITYER